MASSNSIRRDVLKRNIAKGLYQIRCKYSYTDDFAYDNATGFGKSDWREATAEDFSDYDFKTKSGGAWLNADGTITFMVHSNLSYELREIPADAPKGESRLNELPVEYKENCEWGVTEEEVKAFYAYFVDNHKDTSLETFARTLASRKYPVSVIATFASVVTGRTVSDTVVDFLIAPDPDEIEFAEVPAGATAVQFGEFIKDKIDGFEVRCPWGYMFELETVWVPVSIERFSAFELSSIVGVTQKEGVYRVELSNETVYEFREHETGFITLTSQNEESKYYSVPDNAHPGKAARVFEAGGITDSFDGGYIVKVPASFELETATSRAEAVTEELKAAAEGTAEPSALSLPFIPDPAPAGSEREAVAVQASSNIDDALQALENLDTFRKQNRPALAPSAAAPVVSAAEVAARYRTTYGKHWQTMLDRGFPADGDPVKIAALIAGEAEPEVYNLGKPLQQALRIDPVIHKPEDIRPHGIPSEPVIIDASLLECTNFSKPRK